ncbi:MAG: protein phosphatase 2C domain-containing protein [Bacillota bacterium]
MRAWAASDCGLVRGHNEDAYLVLELGDGLACAVADGLGGMQSGEVAAALAVEVVREHLTRQLVRAPGRPLPAHPQAGGTLVDPPAGGALAEPMAGRAAGEVLRDAILAAHRRIGEAGRSRGAVMASTLTLGLLAPGRLEIAHVGDSRAYLFRPATGLRKLTRDHSRVGDLLWRGELTEAQARLHPQRHLLDQAVGTGELIRVDLLGGDLEPGDILLLCTDGLTAVVDSAEIARVLAEGDLSLAPGRLVEMANGRGGPDNVTVVVAEAHWEDAR